MTDIKWPGGKTSYQFKQKISEITDIILNGRLVAVDPASRSAGVAYFEKGKLISSNVIEMPARGSIQQRLRVLYKTLAGSKDIDLMAVEKIRGGRSHVYLKWAAGVAVTAVKSKDMVEVPIGFWRALLPDGYQKTDKNDAEMIGYCLIILAKQLTGSTKYSEELQNIKLKGG